MFYDYSCKIFFLQPIAEGNCDPARPRDTRPQGVRTFPDTQFTIRSKDFWDTRIMSLGLAETRIFRGFSVKIHVSWKSRWFYTRIFWVVTKLMMHGFRYTQIYSRTKNRATRSLTVPTSSWNEIFSRFDFQAKLTIKTICALFFWWQ